MPGLDEPEGRIARRAKQDDLFVSSWTAWEILYHLCEDFIRYKPELLKLDSIGIFDESRIEFYRASGVAKEKLATRLQDEQVIRAFLAEVKTANSLDELYARKLTEFAGRAIARMLAS